MPDDANALEVAVTVFMAYLGADHVEATQHEALDVACRAYAASLGAPPQGTAEPSADPEIRSALAILETVLLDRLPDYIAAKQGLFAAISAWHRRAAPGSGSPSRETVETAAKICEDRAEHWRMADTELSMTWRDEALRCASAIRALTEKGDGNG